MEITGLTFSAHEGPILKSDFELRQGLHYLVDISFPPLPVSIDGTVREVRRFVRMPLKRDLHPRIRTITAATIKKVMGECKDKRWTVQSKGDQARGMTTEGAYYAAGVIPLDGQGFWLRRTKYQGQDVWSDFYLRRGSGDVHAWDTATRALQTQLNIITIPTRGQ